MKELLHLPDLVDNDAQLEDLEELQAQLYSIMVQRFGPAVAAGVRQGCCL